MIKFRTSFLLLFIAILVSATTAKPLFQGINSKMLIQTPPHQDTESIISTAAAEFFASYVKKQANHHLCQIRLSGADISVELDGLHLSRVTTRPPTPEEKTRGITERASIQIEYTAYRTYNQKTGQWSQTCDQPNWYFPATIIIDKSTDGQWRVNPANFHQLNRISDLGASSTIHMKS